MIDRCRTRAGVLLWIVVFVALAGCEGEPPVLLADGRHVSLNHWEGRWLVINYWAEWCAPCRKEIPELNKLHSERASSGAVVLGVNYDGLSGDNLSALVEEMGIDFPVLVADPRLRWGVDQPAVLPTTLIIDPAGQVADVLVGPQHYEDFIRVLGLDP